MPDQPLNFEEHRRRREENASTVRCAKCGKWIAATATRCPECGVNFQGEAQDFVHSTERDESARSAPTWVLVVAVLLVLALVMATLGIG